MTLVVRGYLAAESTPGTRPGDGSVYTAVRTAAAMALHKKDRKLLDQGWSVGRLRHVRKRSGPDGASISLSVPWRGYAAAALEGASPSATLDESDLILNSAWGAGTSFAGYGANTLTSTRFTGATDPLVIGDLMAIYESGQNSGRIQWRTVDTRVSSGVYDVRALTGTFTTAAFSFGHRRWRPNIVPSAGNGSTLSMYVVLENGSAWTLGMGRPSGSIKIVHEAGEESRLETTLMFDRITRESVSAMPTITTFSPAAIMGELSGFLWGGTEYETSRVTLEWALGTADRKAVSGTNGRSNIIVRSADCKVSIAPPFGTTWEDDFDAATVRRLELVHGSALYAAGSPGTLNSSYFCAEAAQLLSHGTDDDASEPRHSIDFDVVDCGVLGDGTTVAPYWSLARA